MTSYAESQYILTDLNIYILLLCLKQGLEPNESSPQHCCANLGSSGCRVRIISPNCLYSETVSGQGKIRPRS